MNNQSHFQFIINPYFLDKPLIGLKHLAKEHWKLCDPEFKGSNQIENLKSIHQSIKKNIDDAFTNNKIPIIISGDCCSSIPVIAAVQQQGLKPLLIWVDAHGDFNTFETTESGHLGGMPLAMLAGLGNIELLSACDTKPLDHSNIVLSDARDLDTKEALLMEQSNINHLKDVGELINYPFANSPIHLHFDTDILKPEDAPAQNYLAKGGPSLQVLHSVFTVLANQNIVAISVSSWNPELDVDGKTVQNCMGLIKTLTENMQPK